MSADPVQKDGAEVWGAWGSVHFRKTFDGVWGGHRHSADSIEHWFLSQSNNITLAGSYCETTDAINSLVSSWHVASRKPLEQKC